MNSRNDATDWRELREFRGVDLTASFVLGWTLEADTLVVDIDLKLDPEHAFYEKPRPAEKICIRPAVLEFPHCDGIRLTDVDGSTDLAAVVASLGAGRIDGLCVYDDGIYEIRGKFGRIVIDSERPVLRLTGRLKAPG